MENRPYTVLLVMDEPREAGRYAGALEQAGFHVARAIDCETALETQGPALDLIISDLLFPSGRFKNDGVDLLNKVARRYGCGKMPFLFYTSFESCRFMSGTQRADEYLVKSDNLEELTSTAKRVIDDHDKVAPLLKTQIFI
jgi:DNA-binding response OmpR family regulator